MKKIICLLALLTNAMGTTNVIVDTKKNTDFDISFTENKTAGYDCYLSEYNQSIITPIKSNTTRNSDILGAPSQTTWSFRAAATTFPQITTITIACLRAWEDKEIPKEQSYRIILK
jgi:predicted secreted protein